jgi:hypothetical protein
VSATYSASFVAPRSEGAILMSTIPGIWRSAYRSPGEQIRASASGSTRPSTTIRTGAGRLARTGRGWRSSRPTLPRRSTAWSSHAQRSMHENPRFASVRANRAQLIERKFRARVTRSTPVAARRRPRGSVMLICVLPCNASPGVIRAPAGPRKILHDHPVGIGGHR